ncbi:MAG: acyl-CoA thioesterase [Flavobacteriaceae bacterium]|jgi:acyl-CoA thioester hydrolase|nr:acyl-CoA thioesterase [Flavobacteriaceae bacterium]MCI5088289.1 acyl-CoA thioesterase [Flavobacteriaceae bacterium]
MISSKKNIEIRYGETDQMGVVYHGSYPAYLEIGRIDWLAQMGFSYAQMERDGHMLPVVSLQIDFKKSLYFGDTLSLETRLLKIPQVKIEFEYRLLNQKGELIGTAKTTLAFMSKHTFKPVACPEGLLKKIKATQI